VKGQQGFRFSSFPFDGIKLSVLVSCIPLEQCKAEQFSKIYSYTGVICNELIIVGMPRQA
jgi:hypothetical protein